MNPSTLDLSDGPQRPLQIIVRSGLSAGAEYAPAATCIIGRGSACQVQLKDEVVSRSHCKVFWEQGCWWIEDLKSANGLFVGERRITREPITDRVLVQLGVGGPAIELIAAGPAPAPAQPPTAPAPPAPPARTMPSDLDHYKSHYFGESGEPAGEHTIMVRRAFAEVRRKQRRFYFGIIAGIVLLLLGTSAYALYRHVQHGKQKEIAADIFYRMKAQEVLLARVLAEAEQQRTAESQARVADLKQRQNELEASYHRFTDTLDVYSKGLSEEERLILKTARVFGECELVIPEDFQRTVMQYIARWKESGRLQQAVTRAKQKGYVPLIMSALADQGLPPQFFYLALQESGMDVNAVGPPTRFGIAKGMWQFIPATADRYGLRTGPLAEQAQPDPQDERHHFQRATLAAARYLRDIYATDAQASGLLVMAAYNWGEQRVVPLLQTMPANPRQRNFWELLGKYRHKIPDETYDYVFSIFSAAVIGENPRLFGFDFDNPLGAKKTP